MVDAAYYDGLLRRVFEGRMVIVCADVLVAGGAVAKFLRALGAERPFLVAGTTGTGDLPSEGDAEIVVLHTGGRSVMENIRAFEDALLDPPQHLLDALERYDPKREALVAGTLFTRDGELWGRRTFGGRPLEWERLEDKMIVDELLDTAGVARASSEIVAAESSALRRAAMELDAGVGTALAGDAKEGWWGGAEYFRWVRNADDLDEACAFFAAHCDRVRVMPFLDGVPCSIHGMVFDEDVIAFRPVEMITLRRPRTNTRPTTNTLLYAGLATYWDPTPSDRERMRDAARAVGAVLRERVDYRGVFTLDGVMSADGFRPTEMNPRAGAGLGPQTAAAGVNLQFVSRLAREEPGMDFKPSELEALVLERADATRAGGAYCTFKAERSSTEYHAIVDTGDGYRFASEDEEPDGRIALGPSAVGAFVGFQPDARKIDTGPAFAARAVRAFALTDEAFGTGLGPLEAAPQVR